MTGAAVAIVGKHSAGLEADGYLIGWFGGDLADDLPTEILPLSGQDVLARWANPTPELLTRVIDGLRSRL